MSASSSRLVIYLAIAANLAIAATKLAAGVWTGSSAMLAEGIHSIVDCGDGLLLLVGVRLSRRPPDEAHPFGHGKDLYFWSLIVGILIFSGGGGMSIYEGIRHLLHPRDAAAHWLLNLAVIGAALAFEGTSFFFAARGFRQYRREHPQLGGVVETIHASKDPASFVVLLEDSAALLGLALAAVGITLSRVTGSPVYDGAASIAIGLVLAAVAVLLASESRGLLIGESAMRAEVRSIRACAERTIGIRRVNRVLTMQLGPDDVLVALDAAYDSGLTRELLADTSARLEQAIRAAHPDVRHVFIDIHAIGDT